MEVIILDTAEQVAEESAKFVQKLLKQKARATLGLATGSTPKLLYKKLIQLYQQRVFSFKSVKAFALDEYVGINKTHPQSYNAYLRENFFDHIDILLKNTFVPEGDAKDLQKAAQRYEKKIKKAGGIDLQILGIGRNGHIGFNEPTSSLSSRTRVKTLSEPTLQDNHRFFKESELQPSVALTMGIATILEAKSILLLATGAAKAEAVAAMVEGPLTAMCPASVLQLHVQTKIILDREAAQNLRLRDYYLWVRKQQNKLFP